jgi:hypothetical protein
LRLAEPIHTPLSNGDASRDFTATECAKMLDFIGEKLIPSPMPPSEGLLRFAQ